MNKARLQFEEEISLNFSEWKRDFTRFTRFTFGHATTDELIDDIYSEAIASVLERLGKQTAEKEVITYKDYLFITFRNLFYSYYEKNKRLQIDFVGDVRQKDNPKLVYYLENEEEIRQVHAAIDTKIEYRLNEVSQVLSEFGLNRKGEQFITLLDNLHNFEKLTSQERHNFNSFISGLGKDIAIAEYIQEHGKRPSYSDSIYSYDKKKRQLRKERVREAKENARAEKQAKLEKTAKLKQKREQNRQKYEEARLVRQKEQVEKTEELKRKKKAEAKKTRQQKTRVVKAVALKANKGKQAIAIAKFDVKTGTVIAFYATKRDADRENKTEVSHYLSGRCYGLKTGYSFRYATEEEIEKYRIRVLKTKQVEKYNVKTGEILAVYACLQQAASEHNLSKQAICKRIERRVVVYDIGFRYAKEETNKIVILQPNADTIPA